MGDYSRELAPVIKWLIVAALAWGVWNVAPGAYQWVKKRVQGMGRHRASVVDP